MYVQQRVLYTTRPAVRTEQRTLLKYSPKDKTEIWLFSALNKQREKELKYDFCFHTQVQMLTRFPYELFTNYSTRQPLAKC